MWELAVVNISDFVVSYVFVLSSFVTPYVSVSHAVYMCGIWNRERKTA